MLAALDAGRKLNQNESPYDLPDSLKREIVERVARAPWPRYPEFVPLCKALKIRQRTANDDGLEVIE